MIELRVPRPSHGGKVIKEVVARYDDRRGHWLCEDPTFYSVLRVIELPDDFAYYPDEALSLVEYVAQLYHGKVKDLRGPKAKAVPGRVY